MAMKVYGGGPNPPVRLDPFQNIIEVGWPRNDLAQYLTFALRMSNYYEIASVSKHGVRWYNAFDYAFFDVQHSLNYWTPGAYSDDLWHNVSLPPEQIVDLPGWGEPPDYSVVPMVEFNSDEHPNYHSRWRNPAGASLGIPAPGGAMFLAGQAGIDDYDGDTLLSDRAIFPPSTIAATYRERPFAYVGAVAAPRTIPGRSLIGGPDSAVDRELWVLFEAITA